MQSKPPASAAFRFARPARSRVDRCSNRWRDERPRPHRHPRQHEFSGEGLCTLHTEPSAAELLYVGRGGLRELTGEARAERWPPSWNEALALWRRLPEAVGTAPPRAFFACIEVQWLLAEGAEPLMFSASGVLPSKQDALLAAEELTWVEIRK